MFQRIEFIGNLGKDPEMRYTAAGQSVTKFNVATSRVWHDAEGEKKETTWFRVTVWGKQAEACNNYLHKGSQVFVEGRMIPDINTGGPKMWKGNDDMLHTSFEVNANFVRFLSTKKEQSAEAVDGHAEPDYVDAEKETSESEEIPF